MRHPPLPSIGLSADLAQRLTRETKRRFGKLGYAFAAISVLMSARPFRAVIAGAGEAVKVRTLQIAVGNGRVLAYLALLGMATLWFNFIGINYFSTTSQHSYASGAPAVSVPISTPADIR